MLIKLVPLTRVTQTFGTTRTFVTTPGAGLVEAPRLVSTGNHVNRRSLEEVGERMVKIRFCDDTSSKYPYVWLRENCQCPSCFNSDAVARLFLTDDLDLHVRPKDIQVCDGSLEVVWNDEHTSRYTGEWLYQRAFTPQARQLQRSSYRLSRMMWGSEFEVPRIDYRSAMEKDETMLELLVLLERYGVVILTEASTRLGSLIDMIERIGFVKPTHYGKDYQLKAVVSPNNLAYTGSKLGLHSDLPYTQDPPGTTWLHCIHQHEGKGGDNTVSDGAKGVSILKERHPDHYNTLLHTPIYFQDQGFHTYDFYKITKRNTITLDEEGQLNQIYISSQSRDSMMDLDPEQVYDFYVALKVFNDILIEHGITIKTKSGEILALDNTRLLHGRKSFDPATTIGFRHMHNAYIDWDDLRSKRRLLQSSMGVSLT
ncbi:hypothetical protein Pmani_002969 [Petrolisthes manimaculis]|uniref:Gamma-butyrobetaine dioxygenase n=1 Tax=Petrolisthes manimaculis TaxID=1843537 RepID=A0AAE1QGS9_9EUCA|nr:hypothetical protein Pmani_002969 [Petrolisthes manimaculis]